MEKLLPTITGPRDLRQLKPQDLPKVAGEIRDEILATVSKTGGHLASSLGAVELAIAIHYVFDTPNARVLWDVGHQAYPHKLLTGRMDRFSSLRQLGGLSGFPNKDESPEHDIFTCGHSSTSISTALGLVMARDLAGAKHKVFAVIGDASLAGGMSFILKVVPLEVTLGILLWIGLVIVGQGLGNGHVARRDAPDSRACVSISHLGIAGRGLRRVR